MTSHRWHLVAEPQAVQAARHRVDELPVGGAARSVLALLVSELVTNSVRHAGARGLVVELELAPRGIRVEVSDPGAGFSPPPAPRPGEPRPSGWGLYLVERLSDRWGVELDGRTRVWFELDAAGASA